MRPWTDLLYLTTIAASGLLMVEGLQRPDLTAVEKPASDPQTAFYLPMQITNRAFTAALLSPGSGEHQTMYQEVSELLECVYGCPNTTTCPTHVFYNGVANVTFSSGSVIANATVMFNTSQVDPSIVHIYFILNAKRNEPKTLRLNLDYTTENKVIQTTVPPPTATTQPPTSLPTTTTTTQPPITTTTTTIVLMTKKMAQLATSAKTITTAPMTITYPVTITTKTPPITTRANRHNMPADVPDVSDGIPLTSEWTVVLLVLASAILLLLIIIATMMVVHWCCQNTEPHHMDSGDDPYYTEKTQIPKNPLPEYSTLPPSVAPSVNAGDPPKKNRTGFYAVNP